MYAIFFHKARFLRKEFSENALNKECFFWTIDVDPEGNVDFDGDSNIFKT